MPGRARPVGGVLAAAMARVAMAADADAEIDEFSIGELRRRCELLELNASGSCSVLRTRLRVHFRGIASVVVAASTATLSTLAGGVTSSDSSEDNAEESDDEYYMPRAEDDEDDDDEEEDIRDDQGEWRQARTRRRVR